MVDEAETVRVQLYYSTGICPQLPVQTQAGGCGWPWQAGRQAVAVGGQWAGIMVRACVGRHHGACLCGQAS